MNIEIQHAKMVKSLCKSGADIIKDLDPNSAHLWHMTSCLCGEAGELFDAAKKCFIYDEPLNLENVIEELGDIEFYLEGVRNSLNITREQTLEANIKKLETRYAGMKYSNQQAQERKDKI